MKLLRKKVRNSLLATACIAAAACASVHAADTHSHQIEVLPPTVESGNPKPWTSLEALDADAQFHFIVITDRTGGERKGPWADAMEKINLMRPAFVVSVGDLIQGGTEDLKQLEFEWDELNGMVDTLIPPFFYVAGNHDYSNEVMSDVWTEKFGPSYYAFKYKDALFVTLNSSIFNEANDAPESWIADHKQQMAWLGETLEENQDVRWTYIFMHHPFWREFWWRRLEDDGWRGEFGAKPDNQHATAPAEWAKVEDLLASRDYTAFAGHTHTYEYEADEGTPHRHERISLATTGGGSTIRRGDEPRRTVLRGPDYAEFDHFVWVTMTDDGPVIANLLLDGILPKDFDHFFKQPAVNANELPAE